MAARKERIHHTGHSNRGRDWNIHAATAGSGPIDFDSSLRCVDARKVKYQLDTHVPIGVEGQGNTDFSPKLPGQAFRSPNSDPRETQRLRREAKEKEATLELTAKAATATSIAPFGTSSKGEPLGAGVREPRQKGAKAAPRWNPRQWYEAPSFERVPLQKDEGETWNSMESQQVQGSIKGQDRLMRSVRRPEDVRTPMSEAGNKHPLQYDNEEYYPGRSMVDSKMEDTGNDYQIRPINLPDFHVPPPEGPGADHVGRMRRLREVVKQRYGGRPRLMGVFKSCALTKPGFAFPRDLQHVFDQMGIKVSEEECELLVRGVDKDQKGAMNFEEFADLVYGPGVEVGGPDYRAKERHVNHLTKTLVDSLVRGGQGLGRAFNELDPERRYEISKAQFSNALGTACNHISRQAVDFLWASQFPNEDPSTLEGRKVDWRSFMAQLARFSNENRPPTPVFLQGRKRQYDLVQRTAPLTGGVVPDMDLNRPEQNCADEVTIVADHLCHRTTELPHKPREAAFLTEPFVENIRAKAERVERALPELVSKARLQELLGQRELVHQDELAEVLCRELDAPRVQPPLPPEVPVYASLMPEGMSSMTKTIAPGALGKTGVFRGHGDDAESRPVPQGSSLKLVPADIHSYVATQKCNRDDEVEVARFLEELYRPEDERRIIHRVNDGLNRSLRKLRPARERPPNNEVPRHENYWQARYIMEAIGDGVSQAEASNGGKLKPSKLFKRLDMDGDGYITLSDLHAACERYKVPNSAADLHAVFSALDKDDMGSVDIGEFTRNYEVHQGSLLDNMSKPIKAVHREGGVQYGGPVQDEIDAKQREVLAAHAANAAAHEAFAGSAGSRIGSAPPSASAAGGSPNRLATGSERSSARSQMSRLGSSVLGSPPPPIYGREVGLITGTARISDVIRERCSQWKPTRAELFTSPARSRFGLTVYPDTRHVTEASVPLSASYMEDSERFKTTNSVHSLFAVPDGRSPQRDDEVRRNARNEFRVERIRQRQREFTERCWAANEAAQEFDELKVARKALNLLNYERKVKMSCA